MIVPEKITRSQLADACRAPGLDPDTVKAFSADAMSAVVHVDLMPIPDQPVIVSSHAAIPVVHDSGSHATHETAMGGDH